MRIERSEAGFTLMELIIIVAIIGILAAIALPQITGYREKAYDRTAQSDLRNVATAQEAYYVDQDAYVSCNQATCPTLLPELDYISEGVTLEITATSNGFTGTATHPAGTGRIFTWLQ